MIITEEKKLLSTEEYLEITVDQMVAGINDYQGAIWVISHDLDFLSRIDITHAFQLKDRALRMTAYLPNELDRYYQELVEA